METEEESTNLPKCSVAKLTDHKQIPLHLLEGAKTVAKTKTGFPKKLTAAKGKCGI